jgi:hypothetical protein
MTKDNSTGKNKEFYDLGKKMFDRIQPLKERVLTDNNGRKYITTEPAPQPDWKAEYLKTVDLHCETLDELREAQADLKEARHANERHIARIVDLQDEIRNLTGEE